MYSNNLETGIAEITKRYMHQEYGLDVMTFKNTKNRAWVRLAGRILEKPGVLIPAKRRTGRGVRIGDIK
jgi:hypothetical protein